MPLARSIRFSRLLAGLCLAAGLVFLCAGISSPARAQITPTARVELNDNRSRFFFGQQIYITEDPDFRINPQIIFTRHQNNLRGLRQDGDVLNFSGSQVPVWMVFSVTNNSSREGWVLHFGNLEDGRFSHIRHILVRNESTGKTLIRSMPDGQPAYNTEGLKGAAFPLRLAKGQTQLFIVYADVSGGLAHTLRPSFMSYDRYIHDLTMGTFSSNGLSICLLLLAGFFAAFSLMQREASYLYFSLYFILHLAFYKATDLTFLIQSGTMSAALSLLFILPILTGITFTRRFFELSSNDETPGTLLFLAMAVIFSSLAFSLFLPKDRTIMDEYMTFVPAILGMAICAAVSFAQSQHSKFGGAYMTVAWIVGFVAYTALFAASMGFAGSFAFSLFWFLLLPQGGLFIVAAVRKIHLETEENLVLAARESRTAQSLARLKQSKETADQARLLRVIERERELMAELREREIQRTEDMRRAKEAADEANRAKSAFLAVVSHEIRTPMNGIMGMVRLLMDSKMTRQQTEYLQTVQNSGDTMMALLNDILDFEKIESGNMQLENIDFDMTRLAQGVVTLMSGYAAEKHIELRAEIAEDFPHTLKGDPTRLRQVFLNLVSNAIKFTTQGHVAIILKATPSGKTGEDGGAIHEITCAIEDTGIGISESALKNLFNPFRQAEKSTARKYGGTGLGLAICRRLIEAMGSSIQVESEEGRGSTFFFSLWLEESHPDAAEKSAGGEQASYLDIAVPQMSILIVEDNELNRKVLKSFLDKGQHRLVLCGSADEALEICGQQLFDVILADIRLGEMDGMEFTQLLRQNPDPRIASTPVIALTGDVGIEDQIRYRDAGMSGFLAKPVNPEALFGALAALDLRPSAASSPRRQQEEDDHFDSFAEAAALIGEDGDSPEKKAAAGDGSVPILDKAMLQSLAEALPRSQLNELLRSFTDKADELVDVLRDLKSAENLPFLRERAHELKGMAANFGLSEVSALAGAIETAAKNGDAQGARPEMEKIAGAYQRAYLALKDWREAL